MVTILNVGPPTGNAQKDMAAIDAAIKAANAAYTKNPEAGQVVVKLSSGTYAVTGDPTNPSKGGIELLSGVSLVGEGQGETVIRLVDDFNARINGIVRTALTNVSNVSLSNLTIDGNRANNVGHQAGFICGAKPEEGDTQSNITISGVEIKDCTAYGFNPHEITYNVTIENCVAHGNGLDGFVADYVVGGVYKNNVSYDNDRHGFNVQNSSSQLVLENNEAYDNGFRYVSGGVPSGGAGLTIQRGDVFPEGATDIPWVSDIQIIGGSYHDNGKEGVLVKLSDQVTIDGVDIYGNQRQGVRIEGSTHTTVQNSTIFDNSQEVDNTYDEINIRLREDTKTGNTYYSTDTHILNNTVYSDGAINSRWGVREEPTNDDAGPTRTILENNTVYGMDTGSVSVPGQLNPIFGTSGNDGVKWTAGADEMHGLAGDDVYTVNHSMDVVIEQENEGTDLVQSSIKTYTLDNNVENLTLMGAAAVNGYGNSANNQLTGNALNNVLKGLAGDDTLLGGAGADKMDGGDGNDALDGGTGADSMAGGNGDDTYYVDHAADIVIEKDSNGLGGFDTVRSTVNYALPDEVEKVILLGSAIVAVGNASANILVGNSFNNALDGSKGEDQMQGGLGDDTYYVDDTGDLVIEKSGEGSADQIVTSVNYTLSANVENITASGIGALTLIGNELNNRIVGNSAANILRSAAGNDILNGGAGGDSMEGGDGNDIYYVDNVNDLVVEKSGTLGGIDTVYSSINYALTPDAENLVLIGSAIYGTGNSLSNILVGNAFGNVLNGSSGADRMQGGKGNDSYYVDDRGDVVVETSTGGTSDTIRTSVSYTLSAYVEKLLAIGSSAINLIGNSLNNTISGNIANNTIRSGSGNDVLNGGAGNDLLYGGAGKDVFVFNTALSSRSNKDKIVDFDARYDTIKLENAIFTKLTKTGLLNSGNFTLGSSAKDSNDYVGYVKTTGDLWYDSNGSASGGKVIFANIGINKMISAADFFVI